MGYQPKQAMVCAYNEEEADRIRDALREEYNFYIKVQRILMKNNNNLKLLLYINEIIQNLSYQYNHIFIPPKAR